VAAGSKQLVVPGAPWKAGATLLISDALGSAEYHAETVLVAAVRAGKGAVTLSTALKHDYVAGATVALLSRSITVTSEQYADGGASIKIAPPSPSALQVLPPRCAAKHYDTFEFAHFRLLVPNSSNRLVYLPSPATLGDFALPTLVSIEAHE
jgi:hypothetical protein